MSAVPTRAEGTQVLFRSSKTGDHVLDDYLEAAERGNRTLSAMLGDIFDTGTGLVRQSFVQMRLAAVDRQLQIRSGVFVDPEDGWQNTGAFFARFRGDHASGQTYTATDYVRVSGAVYIVTQDHVSTGTPDMAKLSLLVEVPPLGDNLTALQGAGVAQADRLAYYTDAATAALTPFTSFGRSLVGAADAGAARTALGLQALATANPASLPSLTIGATNTLSLAGDPSLALHAATKQYVDAQVATRQVALGYTPLNAAGGTMTGPLSLNGNPTVGLHAATKQYVDGLAADIADRVLRGGDAMTGKLSFVAASAGAASLAIPHGSAPSSPANGDVWTTTAGLFVRINGVTVGPLAPLASPVFTGTPSGPTFALAAAAGTARRVQVFSGAALRWQFGSDGTAESGSDAGSDFVVQRYNDAGALIDTPFYISRATGVPNFLSTPVAAGSQLGTRRVVRSSTAGKTLVAADSGTCVATSGGITVPSGVFFPGDVVSIYNDSASPVTITEGASVTLRLSGSTSTGNRTLAARGMATIWFNSSSEAVIQGPLT